MDTGYYLFITENCKSNSNFVSGIIEILEQGKVSIQF